MSTPESITATITSGDPMVTSHAAAEPISAPIVPNPVSGLNCPVFWWKYCSPKSGSLGTRAVP